MHEIQDVPIITLDGPSGTGKGTLCHRLAQHLGWHFLDSGAIYRVLALAARRHGVAFDNLDALVLLAKNLDLYFNDTGVYLEGKEVSSFIRTEQCGQDASRLAALGDVREALLWRQRAFALAPGLVTDGRDMGTVVFPEAKLKVYLHASSAERANRRYLQLKKSGDNVSLAQVVEELKMRDARDMAREHAPLKPALDAVSIDTTGLDVSQVFDVVIQLIKTRCYDWGEC